MKKIISHILSITLMILFIFIGVFVFSKIAFSRNSIVRRLEKNNFYELAYKNILNKLDDFVINKEILDDYHKYITKEIVTKDINTTIDNFYYKKDSNLSRYDDFYKIISKYSNDKEIRETYSKNIDEIYTKNIFPTNEFNLLNKYYIGNLDSLFILIIAGVITLFTALILVIINRNAKYIEYSFVGYGVFMLIIGIFLKITFNNFLYTNEYFTKFFVSIISNVFIYQLVFSTIIVLLINCFKLFKKTTK